MAVKVQEVAGIPQERLLALTRGRGARSPKLRRLLAYWRKRMRGRPPGAFRRCVISLSDEPGVRQPPHALCAWLMKVTTGKWPCEGGRCKRKKKKSLLISRQMYREIESVIYQPLNGQRALLDYKAATFSGMHERETVPEMAWGVLAGANAKADASTRRRASLEVKEQRLKYLEEKDLVPNSIQTIASTLLPGETRPWREAHPRRIGYSLLFGGGGGRGIGGLATIGGRGASARNPYRCPAGFEGGGRFTNRSLSTCGTQILSVPGGNITPQTRRAARQAIRQTRNEAGGDGPTPRTAIEISQVHEAQLRKLRGAVPPDLGRPNAKKQSAAINKTMNQLAKATGRDNVLQRVVRRDGVVTTPLVGVSKLASQRNNKDLDGAAYLTKFNKAGSTTGVAELGLFGAGINEIHFALPGNVRVVASAGKKVSPRDAAALRNRAASLAKKNSFPMGGVVSLAEESNLFKLSATAPKVSEPNRKVRVQTEKGVTKIVPRWVFMTFLSKSAPLRNSGDPVFKLVEEVGGPSAKKADETYEKFEQKVLAFHARLQ